MIKCRKRRLFKNDFFGVKKKLFMWRVSKNIKQRNHLLVCQLECLLDIAMMISFPRTEEEVVELEKVYDKYQFVSSEIENIMMRMYGKIYDWRND